MFLAVVAVVVMLVVRGVSAMARVEEVARAVAEEAYNGRGGWQLALGLLANLGTVRNLKSMLLLGNNR